MRESRSATYARGFHATFLTKLLEATNKDLVPDGCRSPDSAPVSPGTVPRGTWDRSARSRVPGAPPSTPSAPSTAHGTHTLLASGMSGKYLHLVSSEL